MSFLRTSIVQVILITLVLLALAHFTPWLADRYETVGVTSAAIVLLGLGIGLRSALYRRFGLGVFAWLWPAYILVDLSSLETLYNLRVCRSGRGPHCRFLLLHAVQRTVPEMGLTRGSKT